MSLSAGKLKDITWSLARKFCLMGAIDCLCTMSVIMAAPHVFGPMQVRRMAPPGLRARVCVCVCVCVCVRANVCARARM